MDGIITKIKNKFKDQDLFEFLSKEISLSELNSLMLNIFSTKAADLKPADVLKGHLSNRFTRASEVSPQNFLAFDRLCYSLLPEGFHAVELSPLAPLGTCASMAPVHQNNIVSTLRNSEVVADATNVMALECAARRKKILLKKPKSTEEIKLACSQRVVRAQKLEREEHLANFRVFSLCSAGRDEGHLSFEIRNLSEQIRFYLILIEELSKKAPIKNCKIKLFQLGDLDHRSIIDDIRNLVSHFRNTELLIEKPEEASTNYYEHLRFMIDLENEQGLSMNYVDGGFTSWTQELLGSRKERLLISGIGSELILKILKPSLPF